MKRSLMLIAIIGLLAGCNGSGNSIFADGKDKEQNKKHLPPGSQVIERLVSPSSAAIYTIFKFREQCFMKYNNGGHRGGIVNINCPLE